MMLAAVPSAILLGSLAFLMCVYIGIHAIVFNKLPKNVKMTFMDEEKTE